VVDLTLDLATQGVFAVGGQAEYLATVSNDGTAATVGNIHVTDTLPAGVVPVAAEGTGWECTIEAQDVSCSRPGPLAPGGEAPQLAITVDLGAAAGSTVSNTATVATADDGNPANDSDTEQTTVARDPDVSLQMSAQPGGGFRVGGESSYAIAVRNVGGEPTGGPVTVTTTLGPGLSFLPSDGGGWTCAPAGQDAVCTHAALGIGERSDLELRVDVEPTAGDDVTANASVDATGDINPANDSAAATSPVTRIDLALTRSHDEGWQAGQQGTYELQVDNVGTAATVGPAVVTDTLPNGVTFSSATGAGWACAASANEVTCNHPASIGPGDAASAIAVVVDLGDAATPTATAAAVVATPDDSNAVNDSASDTIEVADRPLLAPRAAAAKIVTKKTRPTSSGLVQIFVRCPDEAEMRCQGELDLASAGKVKKGARRGRLALGSGDFDVAKGRVAPATVRLSKRHRKLLAKAGKLKLKATATTAGLPAESRKITLRAR
jgi:uncharacterized repeat protein (TIGR01451 family)